MGPGVYDIHSPVVPSVEWIAAKLRSFVEVSCSVSSAAAPRKESVHGAWGRGPALPLPCLHIAS